MKIVCFDFDNVIAEGNIFHVIKELFKHDEKLQQSALNFVRQNQINIRNMPKLIVEGIKLGKGIKYKSVQDVIMGFRPVDGVHETLKVLRDKGYKILVVSSNDKFLIKEYLFANNMLDFVDKIYASQFGIVNGLLTGEIKGNIIKSDKTSVIKEIEDYYRVYKEELIFVGDGLTDSGIMKLVGKGIFFCPKDYTKNEITRDEELSQRKQDGKLFFVEKKDLKEVLKFIS